MSSSTDSDGSATISKSCRPGPVETSFRGGAKLDPGGRQPADPAVIRMEPDADEPVGDHEILHAPVRCEGGAQPVGVDARHEKVGVLRLQPEQLVAHGAAHEVGVEPEIAYVVLYLLAHRAILAALQSGAVSDLRGEWERHAERWIAWARTPGHDSYWQFHRDVFLEMVPPPAGRTLDLGCGEGRLARDLAALGHDVVGVDSSPTLVSAAREASPALELHLADAADLPFEDASFGLVVAFMSLQDVDDLAGVLGEAPGRSSPEGPSASPSCTRSARPERLPRVTRLHRS